MTSPGRNRSLFLVPASLVFYLVLKSWWVGFYWMNPLEWWQFLDTEELRRSLLPSLFYLHAQPPLLNAVLGLCLKILGAKFGIVLHTLHLALVAVNFYLMRSALRSLCFPPSLVWLVLLTPGFLLHQSYFYEPLYSFTFVNLFVWGVLNSSREVGALAIALSATLLSLTHAIFHPVLMLLLVASTFFLLRRNARMPARVGRRLLVAGALLAIPFSVLAKNWILFRTTRLSSWGGCNLALRLGDGSGFADEFTVPPGQPDTPAVLYRPTRSNGARNYNYIEMVSRCARLETEKLAWVRAHLATFAALVAKSVVAEPYASEWGPAQRLWTPAGSRLFGWLPKVRRTLGHGPILAAKLLPALLLFVSLHSSGEDARLLGFVPLSAFYYLHVLAAHAWNPNEQERMNIKFLFFLLLAGLLVMRQLSRLRIDRASSRRVAATPKGEATAGAGPASGSRRPPSTPGPSREAS